MAIARELQSTSQCPNGSISNSVPVGTILGLVLFNTLINDIVELSAPLASLRVTLSPEVQWTHLVEGMPSLGTLIGLRSGPVWTSLNSTWPRPRTAHGSGQASASGQTGGEWIKSSPVQDLGVPRVLSSQPTTAALLLPSSNGQGRENTTKEKRIGEITHQLPLQTKWTRWGK